MMRYHEPSKREARIRALAVLNRMRHGETLSEAAKAENLKAATVRKHVGDQLHQSAPGKRWQATASDRLTAKMNILTPEGLVFAPVRGSGQRRTLGRYNVALRHWREGRPGAEAELAAFAGRRVGGYLLATDPTILLMLEDADEPRMDDLYDPPGGAA